MTKINPEIFRGYDIRGLTTDGSLSPAVAEQIGKALGTLLKQNNGVDAVVGSDNRFSSLPLQTSLVQGLLSAGINVIDLGTVVTPMVYFAQIHYGVAGAIMVTGSHNPPAYNGFKISVHGKSLCGDDLKELHHIIDSQRFAKGTGSVQNKNIFHAYQNMLKDKIKLGPHKLTVVVDPGNGTSALFAPKIIASLGCKVLTINATSDPTFPNHFPDPVLPENLQQLQATVIKTKADLGIAYDGDGDRIGVVDNEGKIVWGDQLLVIFWKDVLSKNPDIKTAFVEVKCSQAIIEELTKLGVKPAFIRTGHSYIKKLMKETGALFTGEMSGHMFFADEYYGFDDAIYASARLLKILSTTKNTLSEELRGVPRYYATPEIRIDCPDKIKFEIVNECRSFFAEQYQIIDVDGVRISCNDGWALLRASNTQPALVIRCEAKTEEKLREFLKILSNQLSKYPALSSQAQELLTKLP